MEGSQRGFSLFPEMCNLTVPCLRHPEEDTLQPYNPPNLTNTWSKVGSNKMRISLRGNLVRRGSILPLLILGKTSWETALAILYVFNGFTEICQLTQTPLTFETKRNKIVLKVLLSSFLG